MFIGRNKELESLNNQYHSKKGKLIVIYGKRRLGKTYLLNQFKKDKDSIFYMCRETIDSEQMKLFSKEILKDNDLGSYINTFPNWESVINFLIDQSKKKKLLLIVDEIPYLAQNNKSFLSTLQSIWDVKGEDSNLTIVLTGSSLNFMENEILSQNSPLYGRIDTVIKLEALLFSESSKFLEGFDNEDKIAYYAILGGIPRYLKLLNKKSSLKENIIVNILDSYGFLYQETSLLMKENFRETATYQAILCAIASGSSKIMDISNRTLLDKTKINVYINILMQLDLVRKISPVIVPGGKVNSHNNKYIISEPLFNFYFRFVFPNLNYVESGKTDELYEEKIKDHLNKYIEEKSQLIPQEILKATGIYHNVGGCWNSKESLPLLAYDDKDLLGGQLFYKRIPTTENIDEIKSILKNMGDKSTLKKKYLFFLSGEISNNLTSLEKIDSNIEFRNI